jgi:hypothetical protein
MITLKEWMELVDYRITEGSEYYNSRYGNAVYSLDSWNGEQDGYSFTIIFGNQTQTVYEVQAHDYLHNRAYRMFAEGFEAPVGEDENAWDDLKYVTLDVDDDFIQKALAIKAREDYDTRVSVPVDFSDDELLRYMTLAHERDITFNQLVEEALRYAIDEYDRDPENMKARAKEWKYENDLHGYHTD